MSSNYFAWTIMASSSPIPLRVSNKKAHRYIAFTPPHLRRLDRHSSASVPTKRVLGRPAFVNARGGLAILVDDKNAHHDPGTAELERWDSERLRGVEEQLALAEEHEARAALDPDRAMSEEAVLKRKEREERKPRGKVNPLELTQGISNEGLSAPLTTEPIPDPESSRATRSHRSGMTVPRNSTTPYTVHVPGASSTFEWYALSQHSFTTLAAACDAGIWDYPETPMQHARCGVFRNLWEKGYFLGGGIKFGGEYLVYPGDSLRYHSHFVASVIESPAAPLRPMELVAHGRLGTGTKKAHLLCEWDEDKKTVTYYSIEWAGFG
ncbi:hypothetical protein J3R82DRAFT_6052 [Butyriboletus roseoflavus]|nr:hypothetical protein J3R82DRAFT_6052 [Butyriboletus roseoflavus]